MREFIPTTPEDTARAAIDRMKEQKAQNPGCSDIVLLARHGESLDLVSIRDPEKFSRLVDWFTRGAQAVIGCVMIIKDSCGVS